MEFTFQGLHAAPSKINQRKVCAGRDLKDHPLPTPLMWEDATHWINTFLVLKQNKATQVGEDGFSVCTPTAATCCTPKQPVTSV